MLCQTENFRPFLSLSLGAFVSAKTIELDKPCQMLNSSWFGPLHNPP